MEIHPYLQDKIKSAKMFILTENSPQRDWEKAVKLFEATAKKEPEWSKTIRESMR